jgi:hypothetical protein
VEAGPEVVAMGKVDVAAKVVGQAASPRLVGELRQGPNPLWTATRRSATTAAKPVTGHRIVIARGSLLLVEQMQPLVLVTPVLVTISELTATTPMASDTMILHRTMPLTPARIVELVEEAVYTVLDTTGDCNPHQWIFNTGASNHMTGARDAFSNLDAGVVGTIRFGDGSIIQIKGCGTSR